VEKFGGLMNWMERGWPALKGFSRVLARLTAQLIRFSGRFSRVRSPPDLQRLLYLVYSATADETPATLFSPAVPWVLETDASDFMWGGVLTSPGGKVFTVQEVFLPHEVSLHITWKETVAVPRCLQRLWHKLPLGAAIDCITDCTTTCAVVNKGSPVLALTSVVSPLFAAAAKHRVKLTCFWRPGHLNGLADQLSRVWNETEDFRLESSYLWEVCRWWGREVLIDAFAAAHNRQTHAFISRYYHPDAILTNAFSVNWATLEGLYMNPPWTLMGRVAKKISTEKPTLLLVAPLWR
jgi:hypothetical protein